MKKYLLLFFFLSPICIVWGQTKLPDDFSQRLGRLVKNPQLADSVLANDSTGRNIDKQNILIDSVYMETFVRNIFVIRQNYSLFNKKNKLYYGYNDQDYFGNTYSLGIKCDKFTILFDEAVHPWKYDSKYPDFEDKKLEPKITKTHVLLLDDSVSYNYSELDSAILVKKAIRDDMFYAAGTLTSSQEGLMINVSDSCKAGVLVWIMKKSGDLEKGDIKLDFKYVAKNLELLGNIAITPPADSRDVIGCLYLTESGSKEIPYLLSGIGSLKNKQWTLCFPFKNFQLDSAKEIKKPKEKGRLTEIKPKKAK